jgi:hypothetical protein
MHEKDPLQISLSILLKLSGLAFALLFPTLPSFGYCSPPHPTVACEFLNSDAVFIGTVILARTVPPRGEEIDGWLYDLTVQELFRGPRTRTIEVFTENTNGRFPLEVGKQYLLFAGELDGRLTIDCCGNSAELLDAQEAIRELHGLEIPKDAAIEGRISFSGAPAPATDIPRLQVIIRAIGRTFKTTSDREGWFHLQVPPGKYSAVVQQIPHWHIAPDGLSVDEPNPFDARKGRCAELQFRADPK